MACEYYVYRPINLDGGFKLGKMRVETREERRAEHAELYAGGKPYAARWVKPGDTSEVEIRIPVAAFVDKGQGAADNVIYLDRADAALRLTERVDVVIDKMRKAGYPGSKVHVILVNLSGGKMPAEALKAMALRVAAAAAGGNVVDPELQDVNNWLRRLSPADQEAFRALTWAAVDDIRANRALLFGGLEEQEKRRVEASGMTAFGIEAEEIRRLVYGVPGKEGGSVESGIKRIRQLPNVQQVYDSLVREFVAGRPPEDRAEAMRQARARYDNMLARAVEWMMLNAGQVELDRGRARHLPTEWAGRYGYTGRRQRGFDPPPVQEKQLSQRERAIQWGQRLRRQLASVATDVVLDTFMNEPGNPVQLGAVIHAVLNDMKVKVPDRILQALNMRPGLRIGPRLDHIVENLERRLSLTAGDLSLLYTLATMDVGGIRTPEALTTTLTLYGELIHSIAPEVPINIEPPGVWLDRLYRAAVESVVQNVEENIDERDAQDGTLNFERAPVRRDLTSILMALFGGARADIDTGTAPSIHDIASAMRHFIEVNRKRWYSAAPGKLPVGEIEHRLGERGVNVKKQTELYLRMFATEAHSWLKRRLPAVLTQAARIDAPTEQVADAIAVAVLGFRHGPDGNDDPRFLVTKRTIVRLLNKHEADVRKIRDALAAGKPDDAARALQAIKLVQEEARKIVRRRIRRAERRRAARNAPPDEEVGPPLAGSSKRPTAVSARERPVPERVVTIGTLLALARGLDDTPADKQTRDNFMRALQQLVLSIVDQRTVKPDALPEPLRPYARTLSWLGALITATDAASTFWGEAPERDMKHVHDLLRKNPGWIVSASDDPTWRPARKVIVTVLMGESFTHEERANLLTMLLAAPAPILQLLNDPHYPDKTVLAELRALGWRTRALGQLISKAVDEYNDNARTHLLADVLSGDRPLETLDQETWVKAVNALGAPLEKALAARRALVAGWSENSVEQSLERVSRLLERYESLLPQAAGGTEERAGLEAAERVKQREGVRMYLLPELAKLRRAVRRELGMHGLGKDTRERLLNVVERVTRLGVDAIGAAGLKARMPEIAEAAAELVTAAVRDFTNGLITGHFWTADRRAPWIVRTLYQISGYFEQAVHDVLGKAKLSQAEKLEGAMRWLAATMDLRVTYGIDGRPYLLTPGEAAEGVQDAQEFRRWLANLVGKQRLDMSAQQAATAAAYIESLVNLAVDVANPRTEDTDVARAARERYSNLANVKIGDDEQLGTQRVITGGPGLADLSRHLDKLGMVPDEVAKSGGDLLGWYMRRVHKLGLADLRAGADGKPNEREVNKALALFPIYSWSFHTLLDTSAGHGVLTRRILYTLKSSRRDVRIANSPEELVRAIDAELQRTASEQGATAANAVVAVGSALGALALWPVSPLAAAVVAVGGGTVLVRSGLSSRLDPEATRSERLEYEINRHHGGLVRQLGRALARTFLRPADAYKLNAELRDVERRAYVIVRRASVTAQRFFNQLLSPALAELRAISSSRAHFQHTWVVKTPADLADPDRALSWLLATVPTEALERVPHEAWTGDRLAQQARRILAEAASSDQVYDVAAVPEPDPVMIQAALDALTPAQREWIVARALPVMRELVRMRTEHWRNVKGEQGSMRGAPVPLVMLGVSAFDSAIGESRTALNHLMREVRGLQHDVSRELSALAARHTTATRNELIDELARFFHVDKRQYADDLEAAADHLIASAATVHDDLAVSKRLYTAFFMRHFHERGIVPNVLHFLEAEPRAIVRTTITEPAVAAAVSHVARLRTSDPERVASVAAWLRSTMDQPGLLAMTQSPADSVAIALRNFAYFRQMFASVYQMAQDAPTALILQPGHPGFLPSAKTAFYHLFLGHGNPVAHALHAIADELGIGSEAVPHWSDTAGALGVAYKIAGHAPPMIDAAKDALSRLQEFRTTLERSKDLKSWLLALNRSKRMLLALGDVVAASEYLSQRFTFFTALHGYTRDQALKAGYKYDLMSDTLIAPDGSRMDTMQFFLHALEAQRQGSGVAGFDAEDVIHRAVVEIDQTYALYASLNMSPFERVVASFPAIGPLVSLFSSFQYNMLSVYAGDLATMLVGGEGITAKDRVFALRRFVKRSAMLMLAGGIGAYTGIINFALGAVKQLLTSAAQTADDTRRLLRELLGGDPETVIPSSLDDPRFAEFERRLDEALGTKGFLRNPLVALANRMTGLDLPVPDFGQRWRLEMPYTAVWRAGGRSDIPPWFRVFSSLSSPLADLWIVSRHYAGGVSDTPGEFEEALVRLVGPDLAARITGHEAVAQADYPIPWSSNVLIPVGAVRVLWAERLVQRWWHGEPARTVRGSVWKPGGGTVTPGEALVGALVSTLAWQTKARERIRWGSYERKVYGELSHDLPGAIEALARGNPRPLMRLNDRLWYAIPVYDPKTGRLRKWRRSDGDYGPLANVHPMLIEADVAGAVARASDALVRTETQRRLLGLTGYSQVQQLEEALGILQQQGYFDPDRNRLDAMRALADGDQDTRTAVLTVLMIASRNGRYALRHDALEAQQHVLGSTPSGEGSPQQ